MARVCEVCGKKPLTGNNISHAHNKTKKTWYPNLQKMKTVKGGAVRSIRVCTRCIRNGAITKPLK